MIKVHDALPSVPGAAMLLTVHDELIFETPEDQVERWVAIAQPLMEHAMELAVPLVVEVGVGRTWAEAKG